MQLPGPEALRPHYSAFLRPDRILGREHQRQAREPLGEHAAAPFAHHQSRHQQRAGTGED